MLIKFTNYIIIRSNGLYFSYECTKTPFTFCLTEKYEEEKLDKSIDELKYNSLHQLRRWQTRALSPLKHPSLFFAGIDFLFYSIINPYYNSGGFLLTK